MTETLLVLLVGFTAISMYKLQSVPKHIAWTMRNGPAYQKALRQLRSVPGRVTNSEIHAVLESLDGHKVTWLGFKEFRLRKHADDLLGLRARSARIRGRLIWAAITCYDLVILGFCGGALLILAGLTPQHARLLTTVQVFAAISCATLVGIIFFNCIEAVVNYARVTSYGLAHHNPRAFASGRAPNRFLLEAATLGGLAVAAVYVDTCVMSFLSSSKLTSFGMPGDSASYVPGLFNDFYASFLTFIFSTPLTPQAALAKLFVLIVSLQGIFVLVVGAAAFTTATTITDSGD